MIKTLYQQQLEKALDIQEKRALDAERELARLRTACMEADNNVEQVLGKALGYPWYKDDQANFAGATEHDGVCTGDHTTESIASEAARKIAGLKRMLQVAIENEYDLRKKLDAAEKFRLELSALVGCSSPDGSAELGAVLYMSAEALADKLVKGHGQGQEHAISDVNSFRVDDLIRPRLTHAYNDALRLIREYLSTLPNAMTIDGAVLLHALKTIRLEAVIAGYVTEQEAQDYMSGRDAGDENDAPAKVYSPEIKAAMRKLADIWRQR
jgi:hypothetical protein